MKKAAYAILLLLLVAGVFLAGSWHGQRGIEQTAASGSRKVLYYVDPMHPAYKSDKPGVALDCGMELVPVYEDGRMGGPGAGMAGLIPGTVAVAADRQQLIGMRMSAAEKASAAQPLRLLGRVAPDETRVYKINAGIAGYIREVSLVTTGSQVRKDQVLASFASPDSITVIQAYLVALNAMDRLRQDGQERQAQTAVASSNFQQRLEQLQNLGMSAIQMEEIKRTRQVPEQIKILAPGDGFVLARNLSAGQKFDRGAEWYQIADLGRVWIVADVFLKEAQYLRPGMSAQVKLSDVETTLPARVAEVLPQFDEVTRTLKVRLVAHNPGYVLRPGMFVDLEVPVTRPAAIVVPADAVVDSGVKKTVYVEKGDGIFEPRTIETGWRAGDQVEVVKGLMVGEKVVVSGTFLLDSESRMKAAASMTGHMHAGHAHAAESVSAPASGTDPLALARAIDPICGMEVDQSKAKAAGRTADYNGQTYYFCSDDCKTKFAKEPAKYSRKTTPGPLTPTGKRLSEFQWEGGKPKDKESAHVGHAHPPAPSSHPPAHQHP